MKLDCGCYQVGNTWVICDHHHVRFNNILSGRHDPVPPKESGDKVVDTRDEFEGNADMRRQVQQRPDALRCVICHYYHGQQVPTVADGMHTVEVQQVGSFLVCTDCQAIVGTTAEDIERAATNKPAEIVSLLGGNIGEMEL